MNITIVVLAAGQGTRMRSELPKVMHSLAGRPMVSYVVDTAQALQPKSLVVVVGHGADLVREALGSGLTYVVQEERLGTGHAVQQAAQVAAGQGEAVLVLYGDTPLIRRETLQEMLDHQQSAGSAVALLTFHPLDPTGYGRIVREGGTGRVLAVVEEKEATSEQRMIGEVSSGIFCFRDRWLWPNLARLQQHITGTEAGLRRREFYLTDLVAMACEGGETVTAHAVADPLEVMGLDRRPRVAQAEGEMRRRINETWMMAGVTLVHPEATYIDAGVEVGGDTVIWPNTFLQGQTRIGRGCALGPGTVIRDSTIGDGCRVELSVVEGAIMEDGSDVGPFGHLRQGAHLGPGVHMGNFGEVKNSYLGPGVKMGHMSYLGDAQVGAGANIGAGTITCNFDGQRKHPTIIGERAFIGSDAMLVAPVSIGAGATIGAGAVVTRDVPPGSVAFGVPARVREESEVE